MDGGKSKKREGLLWRAVRRSWVLDADAGADVCFATRCGMQAVED